MRALSSTQWVEINYEGSSSYFHLRFHEIFMPFLYLLLYYTDTPPLMRLVGNLARFGG
jgi:hypothetical protein